MTDPLKDLPGIKEDALMALGSCRCCAQPLTHDQLFYRIKIERAGFMADAIRERAGMEMMMGSGALARIMGPDRDLAKVIAGPVEVAVHEKCADKVHHLLMLFPEGR